MLAAGTPWPSSSPARRLRLPSATTVATRSPAPASPANVSSCAAAAARERVHLGEDLARGGARGVGSADAGDGGGQRGGVLRRARELDAGDVASSSSASKPASLKHARDLRGEDRVLAADDERGAAGQRVGGVAGPADAGDGARVGALGDVGAGAACRWARRGPCRARRRRCRRRIALGVRADGGRQRGGGDGEADEVGAVEREAAGLRDAARESGRRTPGR